MNNYQNNQHKKRGIIESIMPLLKIYISNTIYCKPYSYVKIIQNLVKLEN